ncbi:MAG: twin-arginine translocase TatA/TatE family subunit [Myxococcota bacterium]
MRFCFAIMLLLFGGRRLPEIAAGLGQAIRNFRHGPREGEGQDGLNAPSSALPPTHGDSHESLKTASSPAQSE